MADTVKPLDKQTGEPVRTIAYVPGSGTLPPSLSRYGAPARFAVPVVSGIEASATESMGLATPASRVARSRVTAAESAAFASSLTVFTGATNWRIRVTNANGTGFTRFGIQELVFLDATGHPIPAVGGTAFGSPGSPPGNVFDGNPATSYIADDFMNTLGAALLGYTFPTEQRVAGVTITEGGSGWPPNAFSLQYEESPGVWVTSNSVSGVPGWGTDESRTFFVTAATVEALADEVLYMFSTGDGEVPEPTIYDELIDDSIGVSSAAILLSGATITAETAASLNIVEIVEYIWRPGVRVAEQLNLSSNTLPQWGKLIRENVALSSPLLTKSFLNMQLIEGVRLRDLLRTSAAAQLVEGVGITSVVKAARGVRVLEKLGLLDAVISAAQLAVTAQEGIALRSQLSLFLGARIADGFGVSSGVTPTLRAMGAILEQLRFSSTITPKVAFAAVVNDKLKLTDAQLLQMIWSGQIADGIEFSVAYSGPAGEFTAWAMNTRNSAVTEYQNFAFNSFGRVGNKYLGAADDGLYELTGPDDDGEAIIASLRGGYMQFGGTRLSRLKEAYVSVRAPNGKVYLKIVTADGLDYAYEVDTRSMRNTKVHMGKGQRARYFAYELVTEGQDFDLDTIEFVPIVVQRRV